MLTEGQTYSFGPFGQMNTYIGTERGLLIFKSAHDGLRYAFEPKAILRQMEYGNIHIPHNVPTTFGIHSSN